MMPRTRGATIISAFGATMALALGEAGCTRAPSGSYPSPGGGSVLSVRSTPSGFDKAASTSVELWPVGCRAGVTVLAWTAETGLPRNVETDWSDDASAEIRVTFGSGVLGLLHRCEERYWVRVAPAADGAGPPCDSRDRYALDRTQGRCTFP